jgi:hypothetical protein
MLSRAMIISSATSRPWEHGPASLLKDHPYRAAVWPPGHPAEIDPACAVPRIALEMMDSCSHLPVKQGFNLLSRHAVNFRYDVPPPPRGARNRSGLTD